MLVATPDNICVFCPAANVSAPNPVVELPVSFQVSIQTV